MAHHANQGVVTVLITKLRTSPCSLMHLEIPVSTLIRTLMNDEGVRRQQAVGLGR